MFSIGGLNSGLDVNTLVDTIVASEIAPRESQISRGRNNFTVELSALGLLQGAVNDFSAAVDNLNRAQTFEKRTVSISDETVLSATAGSSASSGSYRVKVNAVAGNHSIASDSYSDSDTFGTGELTLKLGATDSFTLSLDSSNNTLEGLKEAINAAADNPGINATIINDGNGKRLLLTSEKSGSDFSITLDTSNLTLDAADQNISDNISELTAAANAEIVLGEGSGQIQVQSSTNTFEDLIEGVSLTVKETSDDYITIETRRDTSSAENAILSFVDAYNALINQINDLSLYREGLEPGALVGDATVRTMQSQIRSVIGSSLDTGNIRMLADLGISTEKDGRLAVDSSALSEAVSDHFSELPDFFAGDEGVMARLETVLDGYNSSNGIIRSRMDSLNDNLRELDQDSVDLEIRAEQVRTYWTERFLAMDQLIGQLNQTSQYLTNNLINLNNDDN